MAPLRYINYGPRQQSELLPNGATRGSYAFQQARTFECLHELARKIVWPSWEGMATGWESVAVFGHGDGMGMVYQASMGSSVPGPMPRRRMLPASVTLARGDTAMP